MLPSTWIGFFLLLALCFSIAFKLLDQGSDSLNILSELIGLSLEGALFVGLLSHFERKRNLEAKQGFKNIILNDLQQFLAAISDILSAYLERRGIDHLGFRGEFLWTSFHDENYRGFIQHIRSITEPDLLLNLEGVVVSQFSEFMNNRLLMKSQEVALQINSTHVEILSRFMTLISHCSKMPDPHTYFYKPLDVYEILFSQYRQFKDATI